MKKHLFWTLLSIILLSSCSLKPADPVRAEMEAYVKEHMAPFDPATYKFKHLSDPFEFSYYSDLEKYKSGLKELYDRDPEFCEKEFNKIDALEKKYIGIACREYYMDFYAESENGTKHLLSVQAIFDTEGNMLWFNNFNEKDKLPAYPAINILRNKGEL